MKKWIALLTAALLFMLPLCVHAQEAVPAELQTTPEQPEVSSVPEKNAPLKLLDKLLVLVQGFQGINVHVWDVLLFGFFTGLGVSKNADFEVGFCWVWQFDCSGKSFIFIWIVILQ